MKRDEIKAIGYAVLVVGGMLVANAYAGSDSTFGTATTTITTWLTGSMGKMFSLGALAVGLGVGIVKQSVMSVATGTGIALASSVGPSVLTGIFSATF